MTAISFKSFSGDDYLEISENEDLGVFINRIKEEFGSEWYFLEPLVIKSTDFEEDVISNKLEELHIGDSEFE